MEHKEFDLSAGWKLIADPKCSVFVDITNNYRFSVTDRDTHQSLILTLNEKLCEFSNATYGVNNLTVDISTRTITLLHEPD